MIEYAEPNCCSGTIFGTAGHNTLGNKENATPKMSINATASKLEWSGRANTISTTVSMAVPKIIMLAPLPTRS